MKRIKCISCKSIIFKRAKLNSYLCRDCENESKKMDLSIINENLRKFFLK